MTEINRIDFEELSNNENLGLNEEISEENKELAYKLAKEIMEETDAYNEEKNLEKDSIRIPGQEFVLVSFVGPELTAKTDNYGMRVMGVFPDIESAADHADILRQDRNDGKFDTAVVEMYNFVYSYPVRTEETQEEVDKGLNEILVKHKLDCELSRQLFELRKEKLMKNKNKVLESEKPEDVPETIPMGPPSHLLNVPKLEESLEEEEEEEINKARNPTHARLLKKLQKRQQENSNKLEKSENKDLSKELEKVIIDKKSLNMCIVENKIEGQNYVAICFVGNRGENKRIAIKFLGVFSNRLECENHCKTLIEFDDTYDIVPTEMYGWVPCDPDLRNIKQIHTHDELNEMVVAHEEENEKSMKHHGERISGSKTDKEIRNEEMLRNIDKKMREEVGCTIEEVDNEGEEEVVGMEFSENNINSVEKKPSELFESMLNDSAEMAREKQRIV